MTRRARMLVLGAIVSVAAIALLLGASDVSKLARQARGVRWSWVAVSGALAVFSYACIAQTQRELLRALGASVPRWLFLRLSMASVVVARTLRSAGTSGLAFLALVLSRHGVPVMTTLSMGLGNVLLNAGVAAGFVGLGLLLLVLQPTEESRAALAGYAIGAAIMFGGLAVAWLGLTREAARKVLLRRVERLANRLGRRFGHEDWGPRAHEAGDRLGVAARALIAQPQRTWRAWAWAVVRLTASLFALGACALATGQHLSVLVLLLAFTTMKMAGSLAFVPAGLGIVDGSLAGMLTLLGTPYETSLLIAGLHRVAYHVVPAMVAIALAGPLVRELLWAKDQSVSGLGGSDRMP